jgi:hypothetical protein
VNILLDECTPRMVKKRLPKLNIQTVQEMGWSGLKNGELLAAAESQFDVFVTTESSRPQVGCVVITGQSSADSREINYRH